MATRASIAADLAKARKQADILEQAARDLTNTAADAGMGSTLANISLNWKGDNSNLFLQKGYRLQEKILKSADNLKATAATIRTVALNIYKAELANIERAEAAARNSQRSSGGGGTGSFGGGSGSGGGTR
ncbi:hypothetical protein CIY_34140 [Butyrivibrio fibrisolvens 16/4]|nr:hypothetical protein CIY_34140 [Butyrivibrio fibrisolvens 16/4]